MNLQDLRSELAELAEELPPSSPPPVAAIRLRHRRRVRFRAAIAGIPLLAAALVLFLIVQPGKPSQTVLVGPTTPPTPAASPSNPLFNVIRSVKVPSGASGLLYADGALFAWSHIGGAATNGITRIDITRGQVTATAKLDANGAAFGDHLLWLSVYPFGADAPTGPGQVVALDPATLKVVRRVALPAGPATGYDSRGIASAGGLIWAVGAGTLYAIDPSTAAIVRKIPTPSPPATNGHQVGPGQYGIDIAAPPDGSVLWTAESPDGGGYDAIQVRNPISGAIINSSTQSVGSIGNTAIAAADSYAWLVYRTGMMGSYIQVRNQRGLPATPAPTPIGGSNVISVSLTPDTLWIYDPATHRSACADPTSGHIRRVATVPIGAVASLPDGQIAVTSIGSSVITTIAIADPTPACNS